MSDRAIASRLLPLLDVTRLEPHDPPARIEALCGAVRAATPPPAAVCIGPEHVAGARRALRGTPVRIATVVNFPDGSDDGERILRETRQAVAAGADEIDLVLPWRAFLRGELARVEQALAGAREACHGRCLKLILETGELNDEATIRRAGALGIAAGVDFLKTSTGKVAVNATPQAASAMLDVIADAGAQCGLKIAGGVRTLADADAYLELAEARLGAAWIDPAHFRIGASGLFDTILAALEQT